MHERCWSANDCVDRADRGRWRSCQGDDALRIIRVDDDPEYGVALGSILVSLLEPAHRQGAGLQSLVRARSFLRRLHDGRDVLRGSSLRRDPTAQGAALSGVFERRGRHLASGPSSRSTGWSADTTRSRSLGRRARAVARREWSHGRRRRRSAVHASFYAHRYRGVP